MAAPKVSIVIPVYNGSDYVAEAIESALNQTWENKEVIVVNDGSRDNGATARAVAPFGDRVRYIEKPNGGVATALNRGIEEMQGEYFSWLSHDDLYLPGKLTHQMRLLDKQDDPKQLIAGGFYLVNPQRKPLGVMDVKRMYPARQLEAPLFPVLHCAVNGCTMLIHKSHFDRVGVFDAALPTTQDYDLWFRMLRGQKLLYTSSIDVLSRVHENQSSITMSDIHAAECTQLWVNMFQQLTENEMIRMAGSVHAFYVDMYTHFATRTSYKDVAAYLKQAGNVQDGEESSFIQDNRLTQLIHRVQLKWLSLKN